MDLKELRLKKGLTQKELGDLIGKHRSLITMIESGSANITVNTAKALGKVLKVRWTKFFED